jgi:hypothetical protein
LKLNDVALMEMDLDVGDVRCARWNSIQGDTRGANDMRASHLIAALGLFAALTAFSPKAHADFTVIIDCRGASGQPTWAPSFDGIRVHAFITATASWKELPRAPGTCRIDDGWIFHQAGLDVDDIHPGVGLKVTTNGSDALFIDKLTLWQHHCSQAGVGCTKEQQWGVDNNVGYCVSETPSDGNNSFCLQSVAKDPWLFPFD